MTKSNRLFSSTRDKAGLSPAIVFFILLCCWLPASTSALAIQSHTVMNGPFTSTVEVNAQCVRCHESQAADLHKSVHWTWARSRTIGNSTVLSKKMTDLTRFGIAAAVNPEACRRCHIGIQSTIVANSTEPTTKIDCLICHDTTGTYRSGGQNADLEHIARTVGTPTPRNCRSCHQRQCGLAPQAERLPSRDVHIERYGFTCQQCHPADGGHDLRRTLNSETASAEKQDCAACHSQTPHSLSRLNQHALLIACQSCHIPEYGKNGPVIVSWNWLLSGNSTSTYQQQNTLLADRGVFLGQEIVPHYFCDTGSAEIYTRGTKIHPEQTTLLQGPGPRTPASKITPFTVQYGTQLYDTKYRYLISPKLPRAKAPFFNGTDWEQVITPGMNQIRLPYSGQYGFTTTVSFRRVNHGVVPKNQALDCMDCHGSKTRFNWQQLGYERDPWTGELENVSPPAKEIMPTDGLPPIRETILPVRPPT